MSLERRFRLLLACYPREHRRMYEEEMLGVLMDDGATGRRRPLARDVSALLAGALRARLRSSSRAWSRALADPRWRDAAAATGLLAALVLLGYALRPVLLGVGIAVTDLGRTGRWNWSNTDGLIAWHSLPRMMAWTAVLMLATAGRRRAAAIVAWAAIALETVRLAIDYGQLAALAVTQTWLLALALLGAAGLSVSGGRPGAAVLGRIRLAAFAGTVLLWSVASVVAFVVPDHSTGFGASVPVLLRADVGRFESLVNLTAFVLTAACLFSIPASLRRRLLTLLAPVFATLVLTRLRPAGWMTTAGYEGGLTPAGWLAVVVSAALAALCGMAFVRLRERPEPAGFIAPRSGQR
jgi:hypothetical protein